MNRAEYIERLFPADPILCQTVESISQAGLPAMSVKPELGKLLTIFVATTGAKRVLEIGTYGGYSAICLARGLAADGSVTSLEVREEHARLAEANIARAGLTSRVEILLGDALTSLRTLAEGGSTFDVVFIDADKPNYPQYLEYALSMSVPGTVLIADNVLLRDRVLDESNQSPSPVAVRAFNQTWMSHPRLDATILSAHDGFAIARVRN
ncbi:O-methyltransferase [Alicyclobacillus fastidiosus]|uniref:O-methyltransferase n=1 Tax=Alicyclobacillus fastidiosus TaxID=392011 RepID=A0ABY6ZF52_9BACL|nr:O-methyltransferase [Alicyclobacillus fastidiosus]WAH41535.1 O-methyltransferase [Alicyclobacillus fastidiosus]GMA63189.1 O-methyltransferase [Alicyclobacillus fastidiosus]